MLAPRYRNCYNPDSMNSLDGATPVVGGCVLSVDEDGRVLVEGRRLLAGDGVARAIARLVVPDIATDAPEQGIAVDQTNTSVVVDGRLVVKLVGRWAAADRAGDLLERLAAAGSDDVARLHGRVEWRHPLLGDGTLAIVTEYLPGAEDGWTWAVEDAVAALRGAPDPEWPAELGARVARIHDVLGADALPSGADAPAARRARAEAAVSGAVAAAEGATGARLRNRRAALERGIRSLGDTAPGFEFPIHGDLHVGQVLASPDDAAPGRRRYTVIDFDGDPQLDAADRERPDAAARDVAHLLVSLDLVAAVSQKRLRRADPAAWAWADRARRELLAAYRAELGRAELFDPALLPGFEAEQLAAELHYADRFLPAWRYAPDAAITHRYPSSNDHPEDPWTPPPFEPTSP
jgi:predicted trehalose synthase